LRARWAKDLCWRGDRICSAGTRAVDGQPASIGAVKAMAERGLDISEHRSRQLTERLMTEAHVVVAMTHNHVETMCTAFPLARERIYLLAALAGESHDVEDPYGLPPAVYRAAAGEIARLIDRGYERLMGLVEGR